MIIGYVLMDKNKKLLLRGNSNPELLPVDSKTRKMVKVYKSEKIAMVTRCRSMVRSVKKYWQENYGEYYDDYYQQAKENGDWHGERDRWYKQIEEVVYNNIIAVPVTIDILSS